MSDDTAFRFPIPQLERYTEAVADTGFLPHELDRINSIWDETSTERAGLSGGDETFVESLRKSTAMPLALSPDHEWLFDRIGSAAAVQNNDRYHFELLGIYEPLQLAEYKVGEFFEWHTDFGPGKSSCRKLSVTVQLSDPADYDGGDLQFMINDKAVSAPRDRGTMTIFPSFVLHRVTPVTRGRRRSIVGWISGMPFR